MSKRQIHPVQIFIVFMMILVLILTFPAQVHAGKEPPTYKVGVIGHDIF